MWVVVVGGFFGLFTLLVKAAIDRGSKVSRRRRDIMGDLELLSAMPEDLSSSTASRLLRERIERHLIEYVLLDGQRLTLAHKSMELEPSSEETTSPGVRRSLEPFVSSSLALAIVLALSTVVAAVGDVAGSAGSFTSEHAAGVTGLVAAVLGVVVPLVVIRFREPPEFDESDMDALTREFIDSVRGGRQERSPAPEAPSNP